MKSCLVALGAALALSAQAEQPLWELGLGMGALRLPHYRGSDQAHDWLLPVPYVVYRGQILRANREGARAVLLDADRFDFDLGLSASAPTRSSDNLARSGMPDLPATLEFGPNFNLRLAQGALWKLDFRLPVQAVTSMQSHPQHLGWTARPVINLDLHWQGWNLGAQAGPVWASRRHNEHFYGVDAAYATPARAAYAATEGRGGWRATLAATRRLGALWLGGYVRTDSVAGAVFESSPLVRQRRQTGFGFALSWVFAVSDERVAREP